MEPKHAWDKLVRITGNVETDCEAVIQLLNENKIYLENYRLATRNRPNLIQNEHQMNIQGLEVKAFINQNIENGEIYLNNAWIITK